MRPIKKWPFMNYSAIAMKGSDTFFKHSQGVD
jgi:hypothetical protein